MDDIANKGADQRSPGLRKRGEVRE